MREGASIPATVSRTLQIGRKPVRVEESGMPLAGTHLPLRAALFQIRWRPLLSRLNMVSSPHLNGKPLSTRLIVAAVVAGWALVPGLTALYAWQDYNDTVGRGEERAQQLAGVVEEFVIRSLRDAEAGMRASADFAGAGQVDTDAVKAFVSRFRKAYPSITALQMVDASAKVAGDGDAAVTASLLAWNQARGAAPADLLIGNPLSPAGGGMAFIPLAMVIAPDTGPPYVTVLAAISADFLAMLHHGLGPSGDTLIVLVNSNGTVLARAPYLDKAVGLDISGSRLFQSVPPTPKSRITVATAPLDGITRMMGISRLDRYALSVAAGFERDKVLSPWRARAWRDGLFALALGCLVTLLGWMARTRIDAEEGLRRELRDSESHHRTALGTLAEGIVTQAPDGSIRTWNDAALRILGLSADQLRGRTSLDPRWRAVREDGSDFPGTEHPAMRALATGAAQPGVLMGIASGDTAARRWIRISALPTRSDGAIDGVVSSFIDCTEKRADDDAIRSLNLALEERVAARTAELAQANAELEDLVYSMAHNMRAPLRHIATYCSMLAAGADPRLNDADQELIRRIQASAQHQARLVDDLLKYAAGTRQPTAFAYIGMDAMVDTVLRDAIAERADDGRIDWVRSPLPRLLGDPGMVAQILEILLSNAVKFSAASEAPRVEIFACQVGGRPAVGIRDNGVGFDMRYADKLFGKFQRLHEGQGYAGTGMELAICKRLVERHGGRIEADGRVGGGATFRFTLAAAPDRGASAAAQPSVK
jgi:signal transduction histidine kinase